MDIHDLQARCGSDMLRGVCCYRTQLDETVRHIHREDGNGEVVDVFEMPYGTLKEVHQFTEQSPHIPFPTEYLIKKREDLKVFRYLLRHLTVEPDYDAFQDLASRFNWLMVSCSVEDTAFRQLLTKKIGVENFVYFMADHPSEMEETLGALAEHHNRTMEVSARGPAEVFISYENTHTDNSSIEWFERYELPMLNTYADIAHECGKTLLVQTCGRIQRLVDLIANARFDGIIDVAPPPTGDLEFRQAISLFSQKGKILAGGIECTAFVHRNLGAFEAEVSALLHGMPSSSGFMLGSGDAVPQGATIEHFQVIQRLLESTTVRERTCL
jgi:hypothetical protein